VIGAYRTVNGIHLEIMIVGKCDPLVLLSACWSLRATALIVSPLFPPPAPSTTTAWTVQEQLSLDRQLWTAPSSSSPLWQGQSVWIANAEASPPPPPSSQDITLLRQALATFYNGNSVDSLQQAEVLLTRVVEKWQSQPADERAGIFRVRGDCYLALADAERAVSDYSRAIDLSVSSAEKDAGSIDAVEVSAAYLGRARAGKSLAVALSTTSTAKDRTRWATQAALDYQLALQYASQSSGDYDDDDDLVAATAKTNQWDMVVLQEGALKNPYAAWEWGDALRLSGQYAPAAEAHTLANIAFATIGDPARSVISRTDAGIDYAMEAAAAAAPSSDKTSWQRAETVLRDAIRRAPGIESRDVSLLQRVIEKEGEGRMALAALLWSDNQRNEAERVLGDACLRLDQLQDQKQSRKTGNDKVPTTATPMLPKLLYSIDDDERGVGGMMACYKFKNPQFLTEKLGWPEPLQRMVIKLETLQ
jgi:tetratricopeptide (TPR) repeat protein